MVLVLCIIGEGGSRSDPRLQWRLGSNKLLVVRSYPRVVSSVIIMLALTWQEKMIHA